MLEVMEDMTKGRRRSIFKTSGTTILLDMVMVKRENGIPCHTTRNEWDTAQPEKIN